VTINDRSGRKLSGARRFESLWVSIAASQASAWESNLRTGLRGPRDPSERDNAVSTWPSSPRPTPTATSVVIQTPVGPNAFGEYDEEPTDTAGEIREFASSGFVNDIVGGCCEDAARSHKGDRGRKSEGLPPRIIKDSFTTEDTEVTETTLDGLSGSYASSVVGAKYRRRRSSPMAGEFHAICRARQSSHFKEGQQFR